MTLFFFELILPLLIRAFYASQSDKFEGGLELFLQRDYNDKFDDSALQYASAVRTLMRETAEEQETPEWWNPLSTAQCVDVRTMLKPSSRKWPR